MTSDWLSVPGAVDAVKAQLTGSGVPLEVRTAQICRDFVDQYDDSDNGFKIQEQRRIYSSDVEGSVFREIDREVTFYQWVPISEKVSWILSIIVPIECKHRDNIHIVGFPSESFKYSDSSVPMRGDVGSTMTDQLRFMYPEELLSEPVTVPSLMQISFDAQSSKIGNIKRVDERLIYNSAGSLYDYVKANVPPMPSVIEPRGLEYLSQFINTSYTENTHPWHLYSVWNSNKDDILLLSEDVIRTYNQIRHPNDVMIFSTDIYFPVLCVDMPLYAVDFAKDHSIADIIRKDFLLSSATIAKWPEQTPHYFVNVGKEMLITVTTPDYLGSLLIMVNKWFRSMARTLQDSEEIITRTSIESAAYEYLMQLSRKKDIQLWAGAR